MRACADGLSPLFISEYKNGDRPFYRHTAGGITVTTAETDKNGSIASIELDETAGFVFGRNPSSQAIIGFGLIKAGKLLLDGASNYFQQGFSRNNDDGVGTDTAVGVEVYSDAISERWRVSASQDYLQTLLLEPF